MLKHKRKLGLIIGILTAVIIANISFDGLSAEGQLCLAFSLMTVIFWATNVAHPLVPALLVYSSIALHYILPFHHLNILVGLGKDNGLYSDREVIKLGLPLTLIVFIIVFFEVVWWQITGLI
ncbi:MAG: hypothetical protein ACQESS_03950 [Bacillota bacterium]